jgi:hypothetical protein
MYQGRLRQSGKASTELNCANIDYVYINLQNNLRGYNIFQNFTNVVILQKQVRAAKCPILLGFLSRLINGEQTVADYELLQVKRDRSTNRDFTTGMRAITPTNRTKQLFNIEAAFQWAQKYGKHVSIFLSRHEWTRTERFHLQ